MTSKKKKKLVPENITMLAVMFGDGAKGAATQIYVNDEYGVTMTCFRPSRNEVFKREFEHTSMPGKKFTTYQAMRKAVNK